MVGIAEGKFVIEGASDKEGDSEGKAVSEGSSDKDGVSEGKLVAEGALDLEGSSDKVGIWEGMLERTVGPRVLEGVLDGDGVGLGESVGAPDGLID